MKIVTRNSTTAVALAAAMAAGIVVGQATADQPHMQNALDALMRARSELQVAAPDKGGHRIAAINFTDRAIEETRAGIRFAH